MAGLTMIPTARIRPNPSQPRKYFEQAALEELAASIRQHGLMQPLVVRPKDEGDWFEIVAGERRYRACRIAGVPEIECRVLVDLNDEEAFILSVTENVARRDMTIIEEANAYKALVALGKTSDDVGALFGKTGKVVRYRMHLLKLRDDLQQLLAKGQLSRNLAWYLARLSHNGQGEVIRKMADGTLRTEDAAMKYANVVYEREVTPDLFGGQRESEADRQRREQARRQIETAWGKLEKAAGVLRDLQELSGDDLAIGLGADLALYEDRLRMLAKAVGGVRNKVALARARHQASQAA